MIIQLQDRNLMVTYLQSFLHDYFGINLVKSVQKYTRATRDKYEIRQNSVLRISGTYNQETYTAAAIYMAYNYPNEQFPDRWDLRSVSSTEWIRTPFDQVKLVDTMNYLISNNIIDKIGDELTPELYMQYVTDYDKYLTYDEIVRYFDSALNVYDTLYDKKYSDIPEYTEDDVKNNLIYFLSHNLSILPYQPRAAELGERVLSYFLDEVVSASSEPDEIMRVQEIMYPLGLSYNKVGRFFDQEIGANGEIIRNSMEDDIKEYQQAFIDRYTTSGTFTPPDGFTGFKVTGYVDPWTEWVIKVGVN